MKRPARPDRFRSRRFAAGAVLAVAALVATALFRASPRVEPDASSAAAGEADRTTDRIALALMAPDGGCAPDRPDPAERRVVRSSRVPEMLESRETPEE